MGGRARPGKAGRTRSQGKKGADAPHRGERDRRLTPRWGGEAGPARAAPACPAGAAGLVLVGRGGHSVAGLRRLPAAAGGRLRGWPRTTTHRPGDKWPYFLM